ncbi:MAG: pentapeptide repeat-containing protein [Okeania sp. SIO3I5]|uniref:pentapeptide repeat-containing protein n=1 Tax=Okeania sp. SIO3I5 TaxID=2607805 RepID=UPI0013B737B6|nr:pentapeptide repeat-containing protein [Okeania sp. SIO3I5]NEQ41233.1 pentapeptide repeat-containing protein [Okeania sp. SIO3I5]
MKDTPKPLIEKIAFQRYKQRLKEGVEGNADQDWEEASEYLRKRPWLVRLWILKQFIRRIFLLKIINPTFKYTWKIIQFLWKVINFLIFPLILPIRLWIFTNKKSFWSNLSDKENRNFNLEIIKLILSMLGLLATISAGGGLILTYIDNREDRKLARENRQLAEERLITDRFSKAIELLGNKDDISVRVGAIFALERIAKDSEKDHWTIMEILTSYIRKYSSQQSSSNVEKNPEEIPIDIQVAITVIGRRDVEKHNDKILNLEKSYLKKADLSGADISNANLFGADISNANLFGADISNANLSNADLSNANLFGADISNANLSNADLSNANLSNADLSNANLFGADIRDAFLIYANLFGADLSGADLRYAFLRDADLSGADLRYAFLGDADLSGANLSGANLSGANLSGANLSGANLSDADLSGANLSGTIINNEQIKTACNWDKAVYTKATYSDSDDKWIPENEEANNQKIKEIEQEKSSNPANPPQCK